MYIYPSFASSWSVDSGERDLGTYGRAYAPTRHLRDRSFSLIINRNSQNALLMFLNYQEAG